MVIQSMISRARKSVVRDSRHGAEMTMNHWNVWVMLPVRLWQL